MNSGIDFFGVGEGNMADHLSGGRVGHLPAASRARGFLASLDPMCKTCLGGCHQVPLLGHRAGAKAANAGTISAPTSSICSNKPLLYATDTSSTPIAAKSRSLSRQ